MWPEATPHITTSKLEAKAMFIAVLNNMPELAGWACSLGFTFWVGRRFERRFG